MDTDNYITSLAIGDYAYCCAALIGHLLVSLACCWDIVQWAVLAVRNLCEDNDANRQYIADMQLCRPTSETVELLSQVGARATRE